MFFKAEALAGDKSNELYNLNPNLYHGPLSGCTRFARTRGFTSLDSFRSIFASEGRVRKGYRKGALSVKCGRT